MVIPPVVKTARCYGDRNLNNYSRALMTASIGRTERGSVALVITPFEELESLTIINVQLRKKVGMVFQRPNSLPVSIRDNILYGYKLHVPGRRSRLRAAEDEIVESSLRQVLLWELRGDYTIGSKSLLSSGASIT